MGWFSKPKAPAAPAYVSRHTVSFGVAMWAVKLIEAKTQDESMEAMDGLYDCIELEVTGRLERRGLSQLAVTGGPQ